MNMKPCLLALATSLIHPAVARVADDFKIDIVKPRCEYFSNPEAVSEGRQPASGAPGVEFLSVKQGKAIFEIESGNDDFRVE